MGGLGGVRGDRVGLQGEGLLDGVGEGDRENGFCIVPALCVGTSL